MQKLSQKHPWAILAAGAAIQVLTGLPAAWGVFQQPVMEEYGLSEQGAGYAFGILIAAFGVGCVIGIVVGVVFLFYKLNRERYYEILAKLKEKAE